MVVRCDPEAVPVAPEVVDEEADVSAHFPLEFQVETPVLGVVDAVSGDEAFD
jgi:hypothetical protein